jgi:cytidine deaminase
METTKIIAGKKLEIQHFCVYLHSKSRIMKKLNLEPIVYECQYDELNSDEQHLIDMAIEATSRSYAPYSNFCVGAAVLLDNGVEIQGCNQENVAYPSGLCAERTALYAAGVQYPRSAVRMLAIAARNHEGELLEEPVSPCGSCRQVIIETETRFHQEVRILLYGKKRIYVTNGIKNLMPLSFTEF